MSLQIVKTKYLKVHGCPDCRKRFETPKGLNGHYSKVHNPKFKIKYDASHRAYLVRK